jgi:DNA-binding NtrC family response regulator
VEDISLLVEHFFLESGQTTPVEHTFSDEAMRSLEGHYWPGNVRELRNLVEATIAMGEPPRVSHAALGDAGAADPIAALLEEPYGVARGTLLEQFESRYLKALVERTEGNVSRAAREAKMDRSHLIDMLRRHGIKTKGK